VDINYIEHNTPRPTLISPDSNVTATLGHFLCGVRDFASAVRITEIAGARHVADDRLGFEFSTDLI
jgi:hypothetical protein